MKEVSVKRKDSSLRDGQGVERRVSEDRSLIFWRGKGGCEVEGNESSRDSASWSTNGSEKEACGRVFWRENLGFDDFAFAFGVSLGFMRE